MVGTTVQSAREREVEGCEWLASNTRTGAVKKKKGGVTRLEGREVVFFQAEKKKGEGGVEGVLWCRRSGGNLARKRGFPWAQLWLVS